MNEQKISWSNLSGWLKTIALVTFISNALILLLYVLGFIEGYLGI